MTRRRRQLVHLLHLERREKRIHGVSLVTCVVAEVEVDLGADLRIVLEGLERKVVELWVEAVADEKSVLLTGSGEEVAVAHLERRAPGGAQRRQSLVEGRQVEPGLDHVLVLDLGESQIGLGHVTSSA